MRLSKHGQKFGQVGVLWFGCAPNAPQYRTAAYHAANHGAAGKKLEYFFTKFRATKDFTKSGLSRHFVPSDFKEGCTIRRLKKGSVSSVFHEYPSYLQPCKQTERSDAALRKRAALY
ncbi:hypothetical protein HPB51_021532 [Rhipicephalus microplus]|uniref:Uncharacterized protein n=1 Tax=Rhipicephalus microplus TaxID=6941 RepID=A0A9J6DJN2_RHIMP|nr:hypothetical protein HPB51_021532 [Rhipicephalus microplus]